MKALHIARAGTAASAGGYTPPASPAYVDEVLADGPLGLWLMDEPSGTTAVDSSTNAADGTYSGGIELAATGPRGVDSARFSSDQVSLPIDLSGTDKMTWEAWVYIDAYDDADKVLSELTTDFNGSAGFLLNPCASASPGLFDIAWHGSSFASVTIARPSAATWHHISISIDRSLASGSGAVVAYVDGVSVTVTTGLTGSGTGNWASGNLFAGARSGVVDSLTCRLWGLAIFDYVLGGARRAVHAQTLPVEVVELDDFPSGVLGGGWNTEGGTWVADGGGWLESSAGDAGGTTYVDIAMPGGATYIEATFWMNGTGTNWVAMRLNHTSSDLLYDNGAYGAIFRPNGTVAATFADVTEEGTPPSTPTSQGTAVTMGVKIESATSYSVWVDGHLVATATGVTTPSGDRFAIGAFNGTVLHLDSVRYS